MVVKGECWGQAVSIRENSRALASSCLCPVRARIGMAIRTRIDMTICARISVTIRACIDMAIRARDNGMTVSPIKDDVSLSSRDVEEHVCM